MGGGTVLGLLGPSGINTGRKSFNGRARPTAAAGAKNSLAFLAFLAFFGGSEAGKLGSENRSFTGAIKCDFQSLRNHTEKVSSERDPNRSPNRSSELVDRVLLSSSESNSHPISFARLFSTATLLFGRLCSKIISSPYKSLSSAYSLASTSLFESLSSLSLQRSKKKACKLAGYLVNREIHSLMLTIGTDKLTIFWDVVFLLEMIDRSCGTARIYQETL